MWRILPAKGDGVAPNLRRGFVLGCALGLVIFCSEPSIAPAGRESSGNLMDAPKLEYQASEPARSSSGRISFPIVLLLVWAAPVAAAAFSSLPGHPGEPPRMAVVAWQRYVLVSLAAGVVLAVVFHRRVRRFSVVAVVIALVLGVAPTVAAVLLMWADRFGRM